MHRHGGWGIHRPQGPSLGSRVFCPGPSSLNQPHPPHSRAHRDLTARGVRHRFVQSFRCRHWPSPRSDRLGTPDIPEICFTRARISNVFRGFTGSLPLRPVRLLAPCTESLLVFTFTIAFSECLAQPFKSGDRVRSEMIDCRDQAVNVS